MISKHFNITLTITNIVCRPRQSTGGRITENMICAANEEEGSDTCQVGLRKMQTYKQKTTMGSENISIKHDLARSCFQLWPKIGDKGDKISRKKTGEALAETVFSRNFVTLGADFEGHN